jgi:hypothetical protein
MLTGCALPTAYFPSGAGGPEQATVPVSRARTKVASDRITSWFVEHTGEFDSAVAAGALDCSDPRQLATRDRPPIGPRRRVVIVPTCRGRTPCQSADSLATRHNRKVDTIGVVPTWAQRRIGAGSGKWQRVRAGGYLRLTRADTRVLSPGNRMGW